MRIFARFGLLALGASLALAVPVCAWEAHLEDIPGLPTALVAIDKADKRLLYFEKRSPLTLSTAVPTISGQAEGDKFQEGDLRTPEGVYFITGRIAGFLDFDEYGSQAHGLNYPNPVDRLRGKTGYGIWIHSKGQPIASQRTKGCIAIDLDDIDALSSRFVPGTAVVVAENIYSSAVPGKTMSDAGESLAPAQESVASLLKGKTEAWNKAWASRSAAMFDFYDGDSYTRAQGESFSAFKAQKERLFSRFDWIRIFYGDIHTLEGPGYWVTWFEQHYTAPNLTTEGIRRLYWQLDRSGEYKIVGMEWLPQDLGLETAYLASVTPNVSDFIERWRKAWEKGDIEAYGTFYSDNAIQDSRTGRESILEQKRRVWGARKPESVKLNSMRIRLDGNGVRVDMGQEYRASGGYHDKGVKEIILKPHGDSWRITSEIWTAQ